MISNNNPERDMQQWEERFEQILQRLREELAVPAARTEQCLSEEDIADYLAEDLKSEKYQRVAEHLETCNYCFRKIVELEKEWTELWLKLQREQSPQIMAEGRMEQEGLLWQKMGDLSAPPGQGWILALPQEKLARAAQAGAWEEAPQLAAKKAFVLRQGIRVETEIYPLSSGNRLLLRLLDEELGEPLAGWKVSLTIVGEQPEEKTTNEQGEADFVLYLGDNFSLLFSPPSASS